MKQGILILCILSLPFLLRSQTPQLLQDIHIPTAHPFEYLSTHFYSLHGNVIFYGLTQEEGYGFWSYDGTQATLISNDGGTASPPAETSDGFYFISAYDVTKYNLFKHGGSPGVTLLIDDVKASSQNNVPTIASLNGQVFYPDYGETTGYELWCAGDSMGSAHLVLDASPGMGSTFPTELTKADSLVYYRVGGTQGRQLWRSDGTAAGTFKLLQVTTSTQNIQTNSLRTLGNKAYFLIRKSSGETELWMSDGTVPGTLKLTDVPSSYADPARFEAFFLNGKYVYLAVDPQNAEVRWAASDGTPSGTELLFETPADTHFFLSFYNSQTFKSILNGSFFFFCRNDSSHEYELWSSNGSAAGTQRIQPLGNSGSPQTLASSNQLFFFLTQNGGNQDIEPWSSDGSATGTKITKSLGILEDYFYYAFGEATDSSVIFRSPFDGPDNVDFPYRSDGTAQGTYPLEGILPPYLAGSEPIGFVTGPNNHVYFRAHDSRLWGIWETDPVSAFAVTQVDTASSQFNYLEVGTPMPAADKMLWFLNDTTLKVLDANGVIIQISLPFKYAGFWSTGPGGNVYFLCKDGQSLWRSDGTIAGTFEMLPAPSNSTFYDLRTVGDSLYFLQRIYAVNQPQYLWSSDGTAAGTSSIEVLTSGSTIMLKEVNARIAFTTYDINPYSRTLHTQGFPNVYFEGSFTNDFAGIAIADTVLYVLGSQTYNPVDSLYYPFWVVENGTPSLLQKFKALTGFNPFQFWRLNNHLQSLQRKTIFGAGLATDNVELWTSDGTVNGTSQLRDLNPTGSSNPDNFIRYNDQLWLFTANDGIEVSWWATDGSADGTFKVSPLATVKDYFVPSITNPYLIGNQLFFSMNDGIIGQEPWVMVLEDSLVVSTIAPLLQEHQLTMWPNPANELVNFTLESQSGKAVWVEITNQAGQVLYQQKHILPENGARSIRLPRQSDGIHFLQVRAENGKIWTKKLIISN